MRFEWDGEKAEISLRKHRVSFDEATTVFLEPTASLRLVCVIDHDLPLNGKWSDLTANFVLFETENAEQGYSLGLEDIISPSRDQDESAA